MVALIAMIRYPITKIFAIDLDGTLYTEKKQVSNKSRESIKRAMDEGIQPIIATGRGPKGAEIALERLGIDLPYICSAGAMIRSGIQGNYIYTNTFHNLAHLQKMISFARQTDTALLAELTTGEIRYFGSPKSLELIDEQTAAEISNSQTRNPEKDFNLPLLKFTLVARRDLMNDFRKMVNKLGVGYNMVISGEQFLDLTAPNTNKGTALEYYAKYIGVLPENVASIGDQEIDIHMLNYSGIKIAMRNAVPELKEVAQVIAPSNEEEGVEWAIQYLLERLTVGNVG